VPSQDNRHKSWLVENNLSTTIRSKARMACAFGMPDGFGYDVRPAILGDIQ